MDVKKIGAFIKTRRTELNMTQKDLAEKIGCTDKAVSRWETGKGLPDISFLVALSQELKISINELLAGEKLITDIKSPEEEEKINIIIQKNDETLAEVLEESQKTIKRHSRFSLGLLVLLCLQMIIFFAVPNFVPNSFEPVEMIIALSAIVSFLVGFSRNKAKWLFPLAISSIFLFINLFNRTSEGFIGFVLSLYFAVGSAIIIAISSSVAYLYRKFKKR